VIGPVFGELAAIFIVVARVFAAFFDDVFEVAVNFADKALNHVAFFLRDAIGLARAAHHVLEFPAFIDFRQNADLVEEAAIIPTVHDDADAAGDGHFVGHDVTTGSGDIITAGSSEVAHGHNHGFGFALLLVGAVAFFADLKIFYSVADFVG